MPFGGLPNRPALGGEREGHAFRRAAEPAGA